MEGDGKFKGNREIAAVSSSSSTVTWRRDSGHCAAAISGQEYNYQ